MASKRITELDSLAGGSVASSDLLPIVDVSDTTMAASGTNKRLSFSGLITALGGSFIASTLPDAKGDLLTATAADTPAILTAGSNGYQLAADSTQTTGLGWRKPGPDIAAANGFHTHTLATASVLGATDLTLDAIMALCWIWIPKDCSFIGASIRLSVQGAAGDKCRLVIYSPSAGRPSGAALLDSGDISLNVTAPAYVLPTWSAVALKAGWYLAGFHGSGSTFRVKNMSGTIESGYGSDNTFGWGLRGSVAYGAGAPSSPSVGPWDTLGMPFIKWKVQ